MHILLNGTVPDGGEGTPVPGSALNAWPVKTVYAWGAFNGAEIAIEHSPDGIEWFPVKKADDSPLKFTDKNSENVVLPSSAIRAVYTTLGSDPEVHAAIA